MIFIRVEAHAPISNFLKKWPLGGPKMANGDMFLDAPNNFRKISFMIRALLL